MDICWSLIVAGSAQLRSSIQTQLTSFTQTQHGTDRLHSSTLVNLEATLSVSLQRQGSLLVGVPNHKQGQLRSNCEREMRAGIWPRALTALPCNIWLVSPRVEQTEIKFPKQEILL